MLTKLQLVKVDKVQPNTKLQELYPIVDGDIKEMRRSLKSYGVITPILVNDIGGDNYRIVAGQKRLFAAKEEELDEIPATIIQVKEEFEILHAILSQGQTEKTWMTKGGEVAYLIEYASSNWNDIKKMNPDYERAADWVGPRMGISPSYVSRILEILEVPGGKFLLNEVDTGELKSFHQAWMKATGKQEPKKQSGLTRENIIGKCNCPRLRDDDGNICPLLMEWINPTAPDAVGQQIQEGGNDAVA